MSIEHRKSATQMRDKYLAEAKIKKSLRETFFTRKTSKRRHMTSAIFVDKKMNKHSSLLDLFLLYTVPKVKFLYLTKIVGSERTRFTKAGSTRLSFLQKDS